MPHPALQAAEWITPTVLQIAKASLEGFSRDQVLTSAPILMGLLNNDFRDIEEWVDTHMSGQIVVDGYDDEGVVKIVFVVEFSDEDCAMHFKLRWM